MKRRGINAENLTKLDLLNRKFQSPFSVEEAGEVLEMSPLPVRRLLARFAAQGWLTRLRRDAYRTVPMGATNPAEIREDPWLVADHAFSPCYFGGWTACEHWGLTEQLFRDVIVVTGRRVRYREVMIQDTKYLLHVRQEKAFFGLRLSRLQAHNTCFYRVIKTTRCISKTTPKRQIGVRFGVRSLMRRSVIRTIEQSV
jgi:predicted transcriptional regulator of viral defense system